PGSRQRIPPLYTAALFARRHRRMAMESRSFLASASMIAALRAALEANPEDLALRLHLGAIVCSASMIAGALEQFVEVLARGAANAAGALGRTLRAGAYRRLYQALAARAGAAAARIGAGNRGHPQCIVACGLSSAEP